MAKQDLYKTAQQSAKLFKLLKENQQLEGWVSAKISKAAEDISTVYQYLNYEKQFQDYSKMIAESTNLSDSKRSLLESKLAEAKDKVKELKKKAAKEKSEKMDENAFDYKNKDGEMKTGDTKKTRTGTLTKTATGVKHTNTSFKDEEHGQANTTHAKAKSAADKKNDAPAQKKSKTGTWGMEAGSKFDNRKTNEAKEKEPEGTYSSKRHETDGQRIARLAKEKMQAKKKAEAEKVSEAKKPLKGGQKKLDADKDGDIEADDLADLRAKKKNEGTYLGKAMAEGKKCPICKKDPCKCGTGKKASGKVKEAIARAKDVLEGKSKKAAKPDFLDMDKDGDKKETMKKAVADKKVIKESAEFDRMKALMTRLNG